MTDVTDDTDTDTDDTDTNTDEPVVIITGTTGTTGMTGTTGDTGNGLDCTVLPPIPVAFQAMTEFDTSEDFDIDTDGYLCTVLSGSLTCRDQLGATKLLAVGLTDTTAGTRVLSTGDWLMADVDHGSLVRIDPLTGGTTVVLSGIDYPNGMEVDENNMVFIGEQSAGRVRQIDAYTGEQWTVATGLINPNGVILSPDGNTLYVGSFGGGRVWAIDRLGPTSWDQPRLLARTASGFGGFDGINVDVCSNVYITEWTTGKIYRITPDGSQVDILVTVPSGWIPNLRWGNGIGGWRTDVLYVASFDQVFALEMQIEGPTHVGLR